ncbi:hypothetical protein niasHT_012550 [Heterodera trifolii]|uniref:G protein-coupled receptor n=1 Tax=Heterodera trifolii TaxID=157864 RepID=A0ABD2L1G7_9BILA
MLLYVPCIVVFAQKRNIRESCYKLMLCMAITCMINIHSNCLFVAIYSLRGDVFCDRPLFTYIAGMFVMDKAGTGNLSVVSFYCCESELSVILALNRCIEMFNHRLAAELFDGHKVYIWLAGITIYSAWMGFCFLPPLANGMVVGYFWQAHVGYLEDAEGWVNKQSLSDALR